MKKRLFHFVVLLLVFSATLAEELDGLTLTRPNGEGIQALDKVQQKRTVAVLSVDAEVSQAIADRLMIRLQEDASLSFVEREQIEQITREQILGLYGAEATSRIHTGTLVGADILVLVSRASSTSGEMIRVLICDTATGARIGQGRMPADHSNIDPLVEIVHSTLARFPNRVETVVTVSDFISRDLEYDYSHLQKDLAELLREALSLHKGIAVVEIDEARSIANEISHSGSDLRRIVPLRVVGEFRTDRLAEGGPQISIEVRMGRGEKDDIRLKSKNLPVDRAGRFIIETVQNKVVAQLGQSDGDGIGLDAQFDQLVQRADQFTEIGDFERSGSLREAAVLLCPDAADQRIKLVREYARWNLNPVDVWPKDAEYLLTDPFWNDIVARSRATWRRSLFHVEYLVRNRQVTLKLGGELFDKTIHSICGIRGISYGALGMEEKLKKDFIRNTAPALFLLEGNPNSKEQGWQTAASKIMDKAFFRVDGNFLAQDDLKLIGDLLCEILPEDMPCPTVLLYRLSSGTNTYQGEDANVSMAQWVEFATRLTKSDRPMVKAYGEYALICHRHYHEKKVLTEDLLVEARQLVAYLDTDAMKKRDVGGDLRQAAAEQAMWIQSKLDRSKQSTPQHSSVGDVAVTATPEPPKVEPQEQSDGSFLCEQVRLKPLSITLVLKDGRHVPLHGHRWRARGGWYGWKGFLPAWQGTDIIYSSGALLFVGANGMAREVLTGENLSLSSVVFDGKYIWAASGHDGGIYVFDTSGGIVAHVRHKNGLPPAYVAMQIHVMEEGKILAAGSIGSRGRGWLATVDLEDSEPQVTVFHEAIKAWNYQEMTPEMIMDPSMRFDPDWIVEHQDSMGDRWFFVGRYRSPLVINAKTLEVSVSALNGSFTTFPRVEPPATAFVSHGGKFYVAGSRGDFKVFEMNPETRTFEESEKRSYKDWHYGNARGGRLLLDDESLYYVGGPRWLRHHLRTGTEEVLLTNPRSLPDYGSGGNWSLSTSQNFGLIAWHNGNLYQVSFDSF